MEIRKQAELCSACLSLDEEESVSRGCAARAVTGGQWLRQMHNA